MPNLTPKEHEQIFRDSERAAKDAAQEPQPTAPDRRPAPGSPGARTMREAAEKNRRRWPGSF